MIRDPRLMLGLFALVVIAFAIALQISGVFACPEC